MQRGKPPQQQDRRLLSAARFAAFGIACWAAGYWTGRTANVAPAGLRPASPPPRPAQARRREATPAPAEHAAEAATGAADATPEPSQVQDKSGSESESSSDASAAPAAGTQQQQGSGGSGASEGDAQEAYDTVDSRGARLRVSGWGIARALQRETPHASAELQALQQRHLSGASLTQEEIESLPMYSYTFSPRRLRSGRRRLICPPWDEQQDKLQIPLKHLPRKKPTSVDQKYDRRAVNCNFGGIWHRVGLDDHRKILGVMVKLLGVQHGDYVFDWGSGCGHKIRFMHEEHRTVGFGLDVSELSVRYALENTTTQNHFCRANGVRTKEWMPENYFDHALSFGSVYHVYNRTMFCSVLRDMVRVVRPGGRVYNGWTENAEFRRKDVAPCLRDLPVTHHIAEERRAFSHVQVFPLKSQQTLPNTYSLVIHKKGPTVPHHWSYIPVACGVFSCNETAYPPLPGSG